MGEYLRSAALVLLGLILSLVVGRQTRELSLLLSVGVCVLLSLSALNFLDPVMDLLHQLRRLGGLDSEAVSILLKAAGIGLVSELACLICADAGEGAMAKALQVLSNAAIFWLSLPLFQQLLTMIEEVLSRN